MIRLRQAYMQPPMFSSKVLRINMGMVRNNSGDCGRLSISDPVVEAQAYLALPQAIL